MGLLSKKIMENIGEKYTYTSKINTSDFKDIIAKTRIKKSDMKQVMKELQHEGLINIHGKLIELRKR